MRKSEYGCSGGSGVSGSLGKIFVGGLPRDTTLATFQKHFGNYGEIVDSVIMKNKHTSQPRGFGFITYSDPAVVDKVMEDNHVINGKQVEIKRTIPKDSMQSNPKDFKTKKIFVGGLPPTLTEDDFKEFFENFGAVVEHQIMHDHQTRRSRGFGFVVFDSDQVVDELLAKGNMIDLAGSKVEIKKAEPKKSTNLPPSAGSDSRSAYHRDSRDRPPRDDIGAGLSGVYSNYGSGGFGPYRNHGSFVGSLSNDGVGDYHGRYGRYYPGIGNYEGMSSFGYPSRFGSYGGGFDGPYAGGNSSAYRRGGDESFDVPGSSSYSGAMYAGAYDPPLGAYGPGGTPDMNRGSFGPGRYHPY